MFFNAFWLSKTEYKIIAQGSYVCKGDLHEAVFCFMQLILDKWTEKCREAGGNSSSLKVLLERTGNGNICTISEISFLLGSPWKSNVVLEKSLKSGWKFFYEPWKTFTFAAPIPHHSAYYVTHHKPHKTQLVSIPKIIFVKIHDLNRQSLS